MAGSVEQRLKSLEREVQNIKTVADSQISLFRKYIDDQQAIQVGVAATQMQEQKQTQLQQQQEQHQQQQQQQQCTDLRTLHDICKEEITKIKG